MDQIVGQQPLPCFIGINPALIAEHHSLATQTFRNCVFCRLFFFLNRFYFVENGNGIPPLWFYFCLDCCFSLSFSEKIRGRITYCFSPNLAVNFHPIWMYMTMIFCTDVTSLGSKDVSRLLLSVFNIWYARYDNKHFPSLEMKKMIPIKSVW